MIKTLKTHIKERKLKKQSFRNAQSLIPIERMKDNILIADNLQVKTYSFDNINYRLLNLEEEKTMFLKFCQLLNTLEPGNTYKYTILKNRLDEAAYRKQRLLGLKDDEYNIYRTEYNNMISDKLKETNMIEEKRFFQVITKKKKFEEAKSFFSRAEEELILSFKELGSELKELYSEDYLKVIYDFMHGDNDFFSMENLEELQTKRYKIRDYLAPYDYMTSEFDDYIKIGKKYMRSLYIAPTGYAKYIKDDVLSDITKLDKTMCVSVDVMPVSTEEANQMVEYQEMAIESNIGKFEERQNKRGTFGINIPYTLRKKRQEISSYAEDINERDQRIFLTLVTLVHVADSLDELNEDTDYLMTMARKNGCDFTIANFEQENGLITALPFGVNRFIGKTGARLRTLTTENLSTFIPFTVQEISQKKGIYYGINKVNKHPIFINRKDGMNGNAIILGGSGSGKSFKNKEEKIPLILESGDKMIIIDPEREYVHLTKSLGGQVINMAADSKDHINAMEINRNYGDNESPVTAKSEEILTLYSMAEGEDKLNPKAKSIIDRCVTNVYAPYILNDYMGNMPTLVDLRDEILRQPEELAKDIALTLELYTTGSLNLFAKETNVDMTKQLICFDISNLGKNLMPIAMLIITDFILNTLSKNREEGVYTWIDIDELYLMFLQEYTAEFFYKLWKRIRKYGGLCTGITQELQDLLKSSTARTMLSNSDFIIMLSANPSDAKLISELFDISNEQMKYITDVGTRNGMIKLGKSFVPFTDNFPKNTELYKLMSTKLRD